MDQKTIIVKYKRLHDILEDIKPVIVAFSGGTDSTLLLKAAKEVLGDEVLAVTALSEITPEHEAADAERLAESFGAEHLYIKTHELDNPEFVKNTPDKCYICKRNRFKMLMDLCREKGFHSVADGENMDDKEDYRPGSLAARELGVSRSSSTSNMPLGYIIVFSTMAPCSR